MAGTVYRKFEDTADAEQDPFKVIQLWQAKQQLTKDSGQQPISTSIHPLSIHRKFSNYLGKEKNFENVVQAYELWENFEKTNPLSLYTSMRSINSFRDTYQTAKRELSKSQALVMVESNKQQVSSSSSSSSSSSTNTMTRRATCKISRLYAS